MPAVNGRLITTSLIGDKGSVMTILVTKVCAVLLLTFFVSSLDAADGDLQVLLKGPKNSSARAINIAGSTIGFRVIDGRDGATDESPFYASKGKIKEVPRLASYTTAFPTSISDTELVVGFCSKPMKEFGNPGHLNLQAFVWNTETGALIALPVLTGHERCMAFGISAKGSRISGVCGGAGIVTACVWEKGATGWECKALPGTANSPLLVTSGANISPDGNSICGVNGVQPVRWTRQPDGSWSVKVLMENDLFLPKAVNDSGNVVGYRRTDNKSGNYLAVIWTAKDGLKEIGLLPNTHSSQALAINNAGIVVGVSEEPGRSGGPQGFVYQDGKLSSLGIPKVVVSHAYAISEKGQIAGYCGRFDDENVFAFVWTPKSK
jgi:probable HAF family extracellular repeat protein